MIYTQRAKLPIVAVGLLVALATTACMTSNEPLGSRDCDCELLKDWARDLPILAAEDTGLNKLGAGETHEGFTVQAWNEETEFDPDHNAAILAALTAAGFEYEIRTDTPDEWWVTITPVGADAQWELDLTSTTEDIFTLNVDIDVHADQHGIENLDELWELYDDDRKAAMEIQEERIQEAIAILGPLKQAIDSLATES